MKLYATTLNFESAFVFAETLDHAKAKFNRLRRILCISERLKHVAHCNELTEFRKVLAHQSQTLLGEPLYNPKTAYQEADEQLRRLLLELELEVA